MINTIFIKRFLVKLNYTENYPSIIDIIHFLYEKI